MHSHSYGMVEKFNGGYFDNQNAQAFIKHVSLLRFIVKRCHMLHLSM